MAIRFTGTGKISQTPNVAASSVYTCSFWMKLNDTIASTFYRSVWKNKTAGASYIDIQSLTDGSGGYRFQAYNGTTLGFSATTVPATSVWIPVGYRRSGTTHAFYVNGVDITALAPYDISAFVFTEMLMGYDGASTNGDFEVAYFREWDTVLSLYDLHIEWSSTTAIHLANLITDTPLLNDLLDDSGNGNDWTASGSTAFTSSPALPSNGNQANATLISSLPFSVTVDPTVGGYAATLWYKIVAAANQWIGVYAYGNPGTYRPYVQVFEGSTLELTGVANNPLQHVLQVGNIYYLKITPFVLPGGGVNLTLSVEQGPTYEAPVGSLFINDDTGALYPAVLVSSVNGAILNYKHPFAVGEAGDVLPLSSGGTYIFEDIVDNNVKVYNAVLASPVVVGSLTPSVRIRANTTHFFVAHSTSPFLVEKVDSAGAIVATYSITGRIFPTAICVNNAGTILYFSEPGPSRRQIKRWDIVGNVLLSDLAPANGSLSVIDLLYLQDDTIIATYTGTNLTAIRYDTSGTILNTYDLGPTTETAARSAYAIDDPVSFWAWTHISNEYPNGNFSNGYSKFMNVNVSTGALTTSLIVAEYEAGLYVPNDAVNFCDTPFARFGPPFSCPLVVARTLISGSEPPPSNTGTITVVKVTSPPGSTQDFGFTADNLTPATFTLQDGGTQVYTGLAPGTYGVTETVPSGWTASYVVSNGSPHDAIVLAEGEDVTVTVTNTLIGNIENSNPSSGIYKIVQDKRQDTLWRSITPRATKDVKIPDPFIKTGRIGK